MTVRDATMLWLGWQCATVFSLVANLVLDHRDARKRRARAATTKENA